MFRKTLIAITLIALAAMGFEAVANGPIRSKSFTGVTNQIPIYPITQGQANITPKVKSYIACPTEEYTVLAWKYNGSTFDLVFPATATDTLTYGCAANSYTLVEGEYDFLVVKHAASATDYWQMYKE